MKGIVKSKSDVFWVKLIIRIYNNCEGMTISNKIVVVLEFGFTINIITSLVIGSQVNDINQ